jgi:signal transduction histidine kinase
MHAGALAYRTDLSPEQIRTTAELIQAKSHEALTDLRQVLGVLRDDPAALAPDGAQGFVEPPQPTFTDLAALVAEAQQSGMRVAFSSQVTAESLPDQVGRTAYRIVQEGLTNARKHAPGATVTVTVSGSAEDGLTVAVANPAVLAGAGSEGMTSPGHLRSAVPGAGLGLVGLRERAKLAGGTVETSGQGGAFELRGWLPWQS